MSRLVFLFQGGGSASTDVLLPKGQPDNHDLAIKRALADLIPRVSKVQPTKKVRKVVYKRYDFDARDAFRDHVIPIDLEALNQRLKELRGETHAEPDKPDGAVPTADTLPAGEQPADPQPDDPEGGAPSD